jgi:serine/threonine-protein kinase
MLQVCEAVASMHAQGIIHRDLKPSNFFLTRGADGAAHVKVLDFGISKAIEADPATDPKLTETQAVFGSPTYMSPEQIRSAKHVDARSDVWSLGVSMFEMLTTKVPFVADNVPGILASIVADEPFRVATFVDGVPEELEAIVLACLEKDPARRISSPAELAHHLAAFASDEGRVLVERIDRIARGVVTGPLTSSNSRPPPRLARPSTPPPLSSARRLGSLPSAAASHPSVPAPVAMGTTDADLRAMRAPSSRKNKLAVALAACGVVAVIAAGAVVVASRAPTKTADVAPAASPPPAAPSSSIAIAPEPSASVAPAPSASAVATPAPHKRRPSAPGAPSRSAGVPTRPNGELSETRN